MSLKLSGDRKFEIEYTTTDNKENIILYKIQGIGGEEVSCEKMEVKLILQELKILKQQ